MLPMTRTKWLKWQSLALFILSRSFNEISNHILRRNEQWYRQRVEKIFLLFHASYPWPRVPLMLLGKFAFLVSPTYLYFLPCIFLSDNKCSPALKRQIWHWLGGEMMLLGKCLPRVKCNRVLAFCSNYKWHMMNPHKAPMIKTELPTTWCTTRIKHPLFFSSLL